MMRKKKVVYVLHSITMGGVEIALLSAVPRLMKQYDLTIVVLGAIDWRLMTNFSKDEKAIFISLDYPTYTYPIKAYSIARLVIDMKPDILVCSLWRASLVGNIVKRRYRQVKYFSFLHAVNFSHKIAKYYNHKSIELADVVLTDSKSTYDYVLEKCNSRGVVRKVSFLTQVNESNRSHRVISADVEIKFMFLARLNKTKNVDKAIRLVYGLLQKGYRIKFDIYGRHDNGYVPAFELVKKLGIENEVSFKGELIVENKFAIFDEYDFLIQLSSLEGMAMSVAEAMQAGLPCVVSPVGEIPNYSQDMESAIFVDYSSVAEWQVSIAKVEKVINSNELYSKISKSCFQNFQNEKVYAESLIESIEKD